MLRQYNDWNRALRFRWHFECIKCGWIKISINASFVGTCKECKGWGHNNWKVIRRSRIRRVWGVRR